jgi:DNA-binding transcriptional regulator YiaG
VLRLYVVSLLRKWESSQTNLLPPAARLMLLL